MDDGEPSLELLQLQWGWITPGTSVAHRVAQDDDYLAFLAAPSNPRTAHFLLTHCGWWLDGAASDWVLRLTSANPEPGRNACPASAATLAALRRWLAAGRLEFVLYPYAACVAEATSGEGLLRSFRASAELAREALGQNPRLVLNHDFCYDLIWGTPQMPRLAALLGIECLGGQVDAIAVGPDGSRVRVIGEKPRFDPLLSGELDVGRAWFVPFELHTSVWLHRTLDAGQHAPVLRAARALRLSEYLAARPSAPPADTRVMGTKGWYGGCPDSLLLEQAVKSVELRLPAIEALACRLPAADRPAAARELADFWKAAWILMDNHILWQCHDYRRHYLPRALELQSQVAAAEAAWLGGGDAEVVFNPVPWPRDVAVTRPGGTVLVRQVPGWGTRAVAGGEPSPPIDGDPLTLRNERLTCRLDERGELTACDVDGVALPVEGAGRLVRIRELPLDETRELPAGKTMDGFEGALAASLVLELPPGREAVWLSVDRLVGSAAVLQAVPLDSPGFAEADTWYKLQSLHWGGPGLPRHTAAIDRLRVATAGASRLRVNLWLLAQGSAALGPLRADDEEGRRLALGATWSVRLLYRVDYARVTPTGHTVIRRTAALQTIRFTGELPDLTCELEVTLRAGAAAVEYTGRFHFPQPTRLGLSSPPFDPADGSLLGAQCERPYVPGLAVLAPVDAGSSYLADKPFYLQRMLTGHLPTWHTDRRDWWLGLSPFIGMNLAVADDPRRRLGLYTRGLKHFFRWRHDGGEWLGLSFGASLIHPMTQGHSVRPGTAAARLARRTDHDPYLDTGFLLARGTYEFHWAWRPATAATDATVLWREAQEFALPASVGRGAEAAGVLVTPGQVAMTAMEPAGDAVRVRLCNLGGEPVEAVVRLPGQRERRVAMGAFGIAEFTVAGAAGPTA